MEIKMKKGKLRKENTGKNGNQHKRLSTKAAPTLGSRCLTQGEAHVYTPTYTKHTVTEMKERTHTVSETGMHF